ncbi:MAG TPA: hypothetical protein VLA12_03020, partial [Planctomycetaceae bacterium]|nr:hypothetical protein [Planctomycetaceae bacterium]
KTHDDCIRPICVRTFQGELSRRATFSLIDSRRDNSGFVERPEISRMAKEKCPENKLIPLRVSSCLSGVASKKSLRRATKSYETSINPEFFPDSPEIDQISRS